jgi:hypothetical protein
MSRTLLIRVECADESDEEWLRPRCVGAVEDVVEETKGEGRLDGDVEVSWDTEEES